MKKLKWLAAVSAMMVLCLGLSACSNHDDEGGGGTNSGLVGTWTRQYGTHQTETYVFGRDGSFELIDVTEGHFYNNKYYSSTTHSKKGSYAYNEATKILVINITTQDGSNMPYTQTYTVHTLDASKLVLIDSYGNSRYYNRK